MGVVFVGYFGLCLETSLGSVAEILIILSTCYQPIYWSCILGAMGIYSGFMLQEDRKVRGTRIFPSGRKERLAYSLEVRKEPNYSLDPNAGSVLKEWQ